MELKLRKDIPTELTWDLSSIYPSEAALRQDMDKLKDLSERIVRDYKGKLATSQTINACLDDLREMYQYSGWPANTVIWLFLWIIMTPTIRN